MKEKKTMKMQNPLTQYYHKDFEKQPQEAPGLSSKMVPVPDCGEETYCGNNRLEGRKVLVTGGDSGIGRATAIAYAREGADVAINYLPDEQSDAEEVKKIIAAEGRKVVLIPGDLSDEKFCKKMVDKAVKELGGLNVMALVAGKQRWVEKIEDLTTEQFVKTFEINVFSLLWTVKAAISHLPAGATIITTASTQAYYPGDGLLDYAATKAAIVGFSQGLSKQLAPKGIRVNIVAPGPVWTPLQVTGGQPQKNIPKFGQETPMKRAGQPVEVAGLYVFLASQESSFITGEVYGVAGGIHIA